MCARYLYTYVCVRMCTCMHTQYEGGNGSSRSIRGSGREAVKELTQPCLCTAMLLWNGIRHSLVFYKKYTEKSCRRREGTLVVLCTTLLNSFPRWSLHSNTHRKRGREEAAARNNGLLRLPPIHVQMCIESAILEAGERVPVFSSPWGREFVLLFQGRPANSTSTQATFLH